MTPLSARQTEVLDYLIRATEADGRPPSQTQIAEHFGVVQSGIRKHLLKLAEAGYIEFEAHSARGLRVLVAPSRRALVPQRRLPVLGRIAAGLPITAAPNIEEWMPVAPEMFSPAASCLSKVQGDSMIRAGIFDGDLVAIHFDPTAESGILAVGIPDALTDDFTVTLKRYRRRGTKVHLESENDDQISYPPMIYAPHEIVVVGRYVGLFRMQGGK